MRRRLIAITLSIVINACGAADDPAEIDIGTLQPNTLALPDRYQRYNEATGELKPAETDWTLLASAEPTDSTCGIELMWLWRAEPVRDDFGDPTIRLFVCEAPSPEAADRFVDSTAIEDSVIPQNDVYEPNLVELDESLEHAQYSTVACVWGESDECRAWAYVGQYGRYVVSSHWIAIATGGALDQEHFVELVTSVDLLVGEAVGSE